MCILYLYTSFKSHCFAVTIRSFVCCRKYLLAAKLGRKFKLDYYCCGKCGIILEFLLPNRKSFFGVLFFFALFLSPGVLKLSLV